MFLKNTIRIELNQFFLQISTLYVTSELLLASELAPGIFDQMSILPILSFDGFFFQNLYNECRTSRSVQSVASPDEIRSMEKYFDLATSNGKRIKDNFVVPASKGKWIENNFVNPSLCRKLIEDSLADLISIKV